jgi:hypothetical protein
MPQRVICSDCSYVLYEGPVFSPLAEIIQQYTGVCPKCGRPLSFLPLNIDIKTVNK